MKPFLLFSVVLLVAHVGFSQSAQNTTVYYEQDALGNVTNLTNSTGDVVEKYTYDVFGKPTIKDGSGNVIPTTAFSNRFMFTGREYVQEIGFYDYRNRVYSDSLGRFLQTDPLLFDKGNYNLYGYAKNDPANKIDPMGLEAECCGKDVTRAVTIALAQIITAFARWSLSEQFSACFSLRNIASAEGSWDMGYLAALKSNRGCKSTVTFYGKCYYGGDVNYLMWGLTNSLCLYPLSDAVGLSGLRKIFRFGGARLVASTIFTIAGYTGSLFQLQGAECKENCKPSHEVGGSIHWQWNGRHM